MAGMDDKPKTKRRWYQFSLRTMFVGMTLACVGFAVMVRWVQSSREWIRERQEWLRVHAYSTEEPPTAAPLLLRLFGEEGIKSTWYHSGEKAEAERLFPEAIVQSDREWLLPPTHWSRRQPGS